MVPRTRPPYQVRLSGAALGARSRWPRIPARAARCSSAPSALVLATQGADRRHRPDRPGAAVPAGPAGAIGGRILQFTWPLLLIGLGVWLMVRRMGDTPGRSSMNRYILIRRLRGPAILLLLGIIALLHQTGVVYHFWHLFWPLVLILMGVLLLAERAALAMEGYQQMYPDAHYPGGHRGRARIPAPGPIPPAPSTSIVPAERNDFERSNGGQS